MMDQDKVNILLVDDQPAKLLAYEVILKELGDRVRARTAELEESHARLLESEQRRTLAIAAGKMGSWDCDWVNGDWMWDAGQYQILGLEPGSFELTPANIQTLFHPDDVQVLHEAWAGFARGAKSYEAEFRIRRPNGEVRRGA